MPQTPHLSRRTMTGLGVAACLAGPMRGVLAQPLGWAAATEYPATAMPGIGLATFARLAGEASAGRILVQPGYDAPDGCAPQPFQRRYRPGAWP